MNRSFGNGVLIRGACLFGSWTLFCYAIVFSEGGFSDLRLWWFVPVIVGLVLGSLCMGGPVSTQRDCTNHVPSSFATFQFRWETALALLALAVVVIVLRMVDFAYWLVWVVLLSATFQVFRLTSGSVPEKIATRVPLPGSQRLGVAALVAFGAILVAITHRPDPDDSQYLNFVVTALDFPSEPLFSRSGLWQDHGTPLELPIYRFHTYELLVAFLSDALIVDHQVVYYLILPPIFGAIAVLVHWRLARYLLPQHALSVLLVWLVLMIALGGSHREFGNFAFVRLYHGKAILVTVALPLCFLLGLRFAEQPGWRRALALAMAAIASLGMSSSALVTVPFTVVAAISGGLAGARQSAVKTIIGGIGSLIVLAVIGGAMVLVMRGAGNLPYGEILPRTGNGLSLVLGAGFLGALLLALFPIAPLFVSDAGRQRLYLLATLTFVLVVFNPFVAPFLATKLDSALLWRLFWSVPLVFSASISLGALTNLMARKVPLFARPAVLPAILVALLLLSRELSISPENRVVIGFPRLKVEPVPYAIAEEIVHDAPHRSTIYVPIPIGLMITTFRFHPYPLLVRPEYMGFTPIRLHFGDEELSRRRRVVNFLEGGDNDPSTVNFFQRQLDSDRPTFVVFERSIEMAPEIGKMLGSAGYIGEERGVYWLWRRG